MKEDWRKYGSLVGYSPTGSQLSCNVLNGNPTRVALKHQSCYITRKPDILIFLEIPKYSWSIIKQNCRNRKHIRPLRWSSKVETNATRPQTIVTSKKIPIPKNRNDRNDKTKTMQCGGCLSSIRDAFCSRSIPCLCNAMPCNAFPALWPLWPYVRRGPLCAALNDNLNNRNMSSKEKEKRKKHRWNPFWRMPPTRVVRAACCAVCCMYCSPWV